jgi:UDP-glucose 4-epimerase
MKIAIIGAGGFIGQHCIQNLNKDHQIISIQRSDVDLLRSDAAVALVNYLKNADAVVILSCITPKKGQTVQQLQQRYVDNVNMMHAINSALHQIKQSRIVYISSDAVYSELQNEITEDTGLNFVNLYAMAHLARERLLLEMQYTHPICILRPCAILGVNDPHNAYGPNSFLREAINSNRITLFGEGEELRNYLYVDDLVKTIAVALENDLIGTYNVAMQQAYSFAEIASMICNLLETDVAIIHKERAIPVRHKIHISHKLSNVLPELEFMPLQDTLKLMYQGLRAVV